MVEGTGQSTLRRAKRSNISIQLLGSHPLSIVEKPHNVLNVLIVLSVVERSSMRILCIKKIRSNLLRIFLDVASGKREGAFADVFAGGFVEEDRVAGEGKIDLAVGRIVHVAEDYGGQDLAGAGVELDGRFHARGQGGVDGGFGACIRNADMLGTDAQHDLIAGKVDRSRRGEVQVQPTGADFGGVAGAFGRAVHEVHGRVAHKVGHKEVGGIAVHFQRRRELLQNAVFHDAYVGRQGHGLQLVMGDIDKGGVRVPVQALELGPHLHTQLGVQVGKRFIHKQDLRSGSKRAGDGHALLLTAGKLAGIAMLKLFDAQHLEQLTDALVDLLFVPLQVFQAEGDVLANGHVGPKRVVLEQEAHVALVGGQVDARVHVKDDLAVNGNLALRGGLETRDHTQGRGLAAAAGAQQSDESVGRDGQVQIVDGDELAKALGYVFQNDLRHLNHLLPCRLKLR